MKYSIDSSVHPAYMQLYKQLRNDIVSGIYKYNDKLPSKRLLSEETGVSSITVEHAYALLCDEGYVEARERSGFFVSFKNTDFFASYSSEEEESEKKNISTERELYTDDVPTFSVSVLSKTMRKVLTDSSSLILQKPPNKGCIQLRTAIKTYLARNRGIEADISQIIIGSGAEYLYSMLIGLLGRDKIYALEYPSYEKIEQVYNANAVKCELLPLSSDGIDSASLSCLNADVLHTTPYRSYPTGVTASATKRHEYIRWASHSDRYIVESDYDSEFSLNARGLETLFALSENDNVIYINTFSKTISPSFRVGYMIIPKKLIKKYDEQLGFYSCTVPTYEQLVLTQLIESGDFERHINKVRRYKRKTLYDKS